MPYKIVKRRGPRPWRVINLDDGRVVGTSLTKKDAEAHVRARYRGKHLRG